MSCVGSRCGALILRLTEGACQPKPKFASEELSGDRFQAERESWMYTDQNVSFVPDVEEVATLCSITEAQRKTWPFYWVVKSGDVDIVLSDHCKM